jgi:thiosulfate/3-mercaptopyruvate sulfurtransferase
MATQLPPTQLPPVVGVDWLMQQATPASGSSDTVVVVHVGTTMSGHDPHQAYLDGHLPDARYVSLDDDLAGQPAPILGRHPLPSTQSFHDVLCRMGIGPDDAVVAYDDRNGAFAARLVWMLRVLGQPAALLDGGLDAWVGPLASEPVEFDVIDRPALPWPADAVADADAVAEHVSNGGVVIDSREAVRYAGELEPIDAVAGHVPGATNLPFGDNLIDGRWRNAAELRDRFESLIDDSQAIVYCGSGVTACHNALAVEAAGLPRPRVYVGSWSGWSTDPDRPIATGHDTAPSAGRDVGGAKPSDGAE